MADKQIEKDGKKAEVAKKEEAPKISKSKGKPQASHAMPTVAPSGRELRGIVRISGKDMKGDVPLVNAVSRVRGIGQSIGKPISKAVLAELKMPQNTLIGELTEPEMQKLEHVLSHPLDYGVPPYMLNRRKDKATGTDKHLIGTDLTFSIAQDIEHEKDIYTWRGYRHAYGQKVRGQHSRTTGRTGMTVGVMRKSIMAKMGAGAAAAGAPGTPGAAPAAGAGTAVKKEAGAATAAPKAAGSAAAAAPAKQEPKK